MTGASATSYLHLVVGGHVDHGKSTLVGRLLADTGSLSEGRIEQVRALCERTSKPFEYAFLLDALKDERAQGITIDAARVFFATSTRRYIVVDAPGHIEFLKNMITGADRAEAAILVIDAHEGIQENSRRHATMLSMLGLRQLAVVVNKMDLAGYQREVFDGVVQTFGAFLGRLGITARIWIPIAAREGANVVDRAAEMPWFTGPTVIEALEAFEPDRPTTDRPFRTPVQDVYKFTKFGDARRIIAGTVESGRAQVGADLVFYPSGARATIRTLEAFGGAAPSEIVAGRAMGITVTPQVYARRGDLAARADEPGPHVTSRMKVSLFWLGRTPLTTDREFLFRLGTARVAGRIETIHRVIDASDLGALASHDQIGRHQVADCTLKLQHAVAFDLAAEIAPTGRFVLVDDYDIRGGGIIQAALPDRETSSRRKVFGRQAKWTTSYLSPERRADRYGQRAALVLVTGEASTERKDLARELEEQLFDDGRHVYFLAMGNVLYGLNADLPRGADERAEHFRRLAEIANLLLDAGLILIVSAADLTAEDLEALRTGVPAELIHTVWVGDRVTTNLEGAAVVTDAEREAHGAAALKRVLEDRRVLAAPGDRT
jgi:bifunctional enzyme CysN/CysC